MDRIHELVRSGRITPRDGAVLLDLRRELAWRRLPWWQRAAIAFMRSVFG